MSCRVWRWSLVVPFLILCGCSNSSQPTSAQGSAAQNEISEAKQVGTAKSIIPVRRGVTTFDGNWVLVITVQVQQEKTTILQDVFAKILEFSKDAEGKFTTKIIDSNSKDSELTESIVDGKSIRFKFKEGQIDVEFVGEFDGIAVRGTLSSGFQDPLLARLLPTEAARLEDYATTALPPAADVFRQAIQQMQNKPQPKVILNLAREHKTSPVALDFTGGLIELSQQMGGFDDELLKTILAEFVNLAKVWGPRRELYAEFYCAQHLLKNSKLQDEAIKHLDQAASLATESNLFAGTVEIWKQKIQPLRQAAELQKSLIKIRSKAIDESEAAFAELREALKLFPHNPQILLTLAEYANSTKQTDAAIEYYSIIVAMPLLQGIILSRRAGQPPGDPLPIDILKKLWIERHGSETSLESHLIAVCKKGIDELRAEVRQHGLPPLSSDVGNHTVLVELFTSVQMPSVVASELAIDVLHEVYPSSKLITLRYHQHIPGPDGLVNQDSEDQIVTYDMARVPAVALDGALLEAGGTLENAATVYNNLRFLIDPRLKQTTDVQVSLEGKIVDGELSIRAEVTGVSEDLLPSCRLRLAIAEDDVEALSPIGLQRHSMVVREMPGGAKGIAPKKGELKYAFSLPLAELQNHIDSHLDRFETGKGFKFPKAARPSIDGPLYLVGWVQNDKYAEQHPEIGRAVLQSAIVEISGTGGTTVPANTVDEPTGQNAEKTAVQESSANAPPPPALPE